jgi:hypothetical protein
MVDKVKSKRRPLIKKKSPLIVLNTPRKLGQDVIDEIERWYYERRPWEDMKVLLAAHGYAMNYQRLLSWCAKAFPERDIWEDFDAEQQTAPAPDREQKALDEILNKTIVSLKALRPSKNSVRSALASLAGTLQRVVAMRINREKLELEKARRTQDSRELIQKAKDEIKRELRYSMPQKPALVAELCEMVDEMKLKSEQDKDEDNGLN